MPLPNKEVWPKSLRGIHQWVQWLSVEGVKVPMQCSFNERASSTDPDTWHEFYDCYRYFDEDKRSGLGFVLTASDPYVVFDLDKVRDPDTGATVDWAEELIETLDSLTYVSTSGTGYHVWVTCKEDLPGPGISIKKNPVHTALEIFGQKRFIVMSGVLHRKVKIADRTEMVLEMYNDIVVIKAARYAKKNAKQQVKKKSFRDLNLSGRNKKGVTLKEWLDRKGVEYRMKGEVFQLAECPWGNDHTGSKDGLGQSAVWVLGDGKWAFSCCHNTCEDRTITDFTAEVRR